MLYKPQMGVNWAAQFLRSGGASHVHLWCRPVGYSATDGRDFAPPPATGYYTGLNARGGASHGIPRRGTLPAMDLTTNRIVWQHKWAGSTA